MKFVVFMIPGLYQPGQKIDPNFAPSLDDVEEMGKFNEELGKACKVLDLNGLHPLQKGARLTYSSGKGKGQITDGPFVEAKEVVGGYWMLEAKSKEEVVHWMKKCPANPDDIIEVRQIFDAADFAPSRKAAKK